MNNHPVSCFCDDCRIARGETFPTDVSAVCREVLERIKSITQFTKEHYGENISGENGRCNSTIPKRGVLEERNKTPRRSVKDVPDTEWDEIAKLHHTTASKPRNRGR